MNAPEKVQSCFDARIGAMIYGIIMSVISGIALLFCIGCYILTNLATSLGYRLSDLHQIEQDTFPLDDVIAVLIANAVITFGLIFLLLDFSFSVVLAEGASKRKSGHLQAYFIYGVIRTVILLIFNIGLFNMFGPVLLLLNGISSVMLSMVYMARQQVNRASKGYDEFNNEVSVIA